MSKKTVLLFGGSFDPFHQGHLEMLNHFLQTIIVTDVLLIPAYQSPQKEAPLFSADERIESLTALIQDPSAISSKNIHITCSDIECSQSEPVYTISTLTKIHQHYPGAKLIMLLGSDQFFNLHTWKKPKSILQLTHLCVFQRDKLSLEHYQHYLEQHGLASQARGFMIFKNELMPYSSTEIRQYIKQGKPLEDRVPFVVQRALGLTV